MSEEEPPSYEEISNTNIEVISDDHKYIELYFTEFRHIDDEDSIRLQELDNENQNRKVLLKLINFDEEEPPTAEQFIMRNNRPKQKEIYTLLKDRNHTDISYSLAQYIMTHFQIHFDLVPDEAREKDYIGGKGFRPPLVIGDMEYGREIDIYNDIFLIWGVRLIQ